MSEPSSLPVGQPAPSGGELRRPGRGEGRLIAGVCAALAERFGLDRTLIRLVFLVFGLFGAGELVYLALWVIIPTRR